MDSEDISALGFWIVIAAFVVAGAWTKVRREAEKHETLRRIVEKTGSIDETKLKELFSEPSPEPTKPGTGYRVLRITGTIVMFLGGLPALFGIAAALFGGKAGIKAPPNDFVVGMLVIAACLVVVGLGLFHASRFAEPPLPSRHEPPAL
jgi:hypothetical protein